MMKKHALIFRNIAPVLLVVFFISCGKAADADKKGAMKKEPVVRTTQVRRADLTTFASVTGTVRPNVSSDISSPQEGVLEKLYVRENNFVSKGDLVALISSNDRNALIAASRFKITESEARLAKLDKNSSAFQEVRAQLEQARKDSAYAASMYQPYPVVAPLTGVVTRRYVDQGTLLTARQPFIAITDMASLVVKVELSETYFAAIRRGDKIIMRFNAYPRIDVQGMVTLVNPEVDSAARSFTLDIQPVGFSEKLLPGMMAELKIPVERKKNVIAIDNDAVLTKPNEDKFVFVVENDVARERPVALGTVSENVTEISSGLREGEWLVVQGQQMLKDGVKVKVLPAAGTRK